MRQGRHGFTLLELSVVLVLIALVLAGGLVTLTANVQTSQFNTTVAKMDVIEKALLDYSTSFSRLPCPSNLTLTASDANYGIEAANQGTCTGGTPAANNIAASGTAEGGVPTRTLQLSDDYMFDGWGRRIRYAVDPTQTPASTLPATTCGSTSSKTITVNDAVGAARSNAAAYVLVSHGSNGHGAYSANGVMVNAGSLNSDELTNCHCTSAGVAGTYTPTYIQKYPVQNSASALNNFDDLVAYKEAWQLQTPNAPLASTSCGSSIYIADSDAHVVRKMVDGGNINAVSGSGDESIMPGLAASTMLYDAEALAVDSSGNWYAADGNYNIAVKVNITSGVVSRIAGQYNVSGSSGDGGLATAAKLNDPSGIAVDSNGNVYIADTGNNVIRKITAATGIISTISGNFTASYNGDGQLAVNAALNQPTTLAMDGSNNLYISDSNNYMIRIITAADGMINRFAGNGTAGYSGNGGNATASKIRKPTYIAVDVSGNLYISDTNNNQVRKVTASTGKIDVLANSATSLGCTGDGGLAINATTHYPNGIAVDITGNVYFVDYQSHNIRKVTPGTNIISTVAGICGTGAEGGDGGPAISATFNGSYGLVISR